MTRRRQIKRRRTGRSRNVEAVTERELQKFVATLRKGLGVDDSFEKRLPVCASKLLRAVATVCCAMLCVFCQKMVGARCWPLSGVAISPCAQILHCRLRRVSSIPNFT